MVPVLGFSGMYIPVPGMSLVVSLIPFLTCYASILKQIPKIKTKSALKLESLLEHPLESQK